MTCATVDMLIDNALFMKKIVLLFCVWLTLLLVVGFLSRGMETYQDRKCDARKSSPYMRWDSWWYQTIARKGYSFSEEKNSSIAFFPLFPGILKAAHSALPVDYSYMALSLNIMFTVLAVWLLYKLARLDFSQRESFAIMAVWLFFPVTYFFLTSYPDALFSLLVVGSFYFARKKRWAWAGAASALLAITKPYGLVMMPVLLIEYLLTQQWDWKVLLKKKDWIALLLPGISFGGFVIFNYLKFGNPLAFLATQKTWGRSYGNPLAVLAQEFHDNIIVGPIFSGTHLPYLGYLASFLAFLWAIWYSWGKVRKTYVLFSALVLLSAFMSGTLTSWGRYSLLTVVIFMAPGALLVKNKYIFYAYLACSGIILLAMANLFVRCFPVE